MKSAIMTLVDVITTSGRKLLSINVGLDSNGRVKHGSGTFEVQPQATERDVVEKIYKKYVVEKDWRFMDTELHLSDNEFVIVRTDETLDRG